jgi:hypothetical protein
MFTWFITNSGARSLQELDRPLPRDLRVVLERSGVPGVRQAMPRVNAEFARARRYQHSLSVALFGRAARMADGAAPAMPPALRPSAPEFHGLFPTVLAAVLREQTRDTDVVTYAAALNRCIVVMPETGRGNAHLAAMRLRELGGMRLRCSLLASVVTFPEEGWTFEELIHLAAREHEPGRPTGPRGERSGPRTSELGAPDGSMPPAAIPPEHV